MSIWVLRGLRGGVATTHWPRRPDTYADSWRGAATARAGAGAVTGVAGLFPAGAIEDGDGAVRVD